MTPNETTIHQKENNVDKFNSLSCIEVNPAKSRQGQLCLEYSRLLNTEISSR